MKQMINVTANMVVTSNQLDCNNVCYDKLAVTAVTTKVVITTVMTKLVVTAVTTKLVISAYF